MKSTTTEQFWRCFDALPPHIQRQAERAFRLWMDDPSHRSLEFKQVHPSQPVFSVRIGLRWRAIGFREGDTLVWTWIGSHADYDSRIARQ